MRVEDLVFEESTATGEGPEQFVGRILRSDERIEVDGSSIVERGQNVEDVLGCRGLVEGDADRILSLETPEIDSSRHRGSVDRIDLRCVDGDREGVEEGVIAAVETETTQPRSERRREAMHSGGDPGQSIGTVVDGVEPRHDGEQDLGGADVARRPITLDVLFTGLDRHAKRRRTGRIDRDSDQTTGHLADIRLLRRHVRGMRSPVAHGDAESLSGSDRDVGPQVTGRLDQDQ